MSWNPGPAEPTSPRILGVDPGSLVTGWGLVGGSPSRPELLESGIIKLGAADSDTLGPRLWRLHQDFESLVRRIRPTTAAVESPYHGSNARSALRLAHARGVILAVLAGSGTEIVEYTPATVKKAVTGNGRAPKEQVRSMVDRILKVREGSRSTDLSDALAVALCHAGSRRYHEIESGAIGSARPGKSAKPSHRGSADPADAT